MRDDAARRIVTSGFYVITTIVMTFYSIGYWREALSSGFDVLLTTKVLATSLLAAAGWIGLILQWRGRRKRG